VAAQKAIVPRSVEQREYPRVADGFNLGHRLLRVGDLLHLEEGPVRDDVGAREDLARADDDAGAGSLCIHCRRHGFQ